MFGIFKGKKKYVRLNGGEDDQLERAALELRKSLIMLGDDIEKTAIEQRVAMEKLKEMTKRMKV